MRAVLLDLFGPGTWGTGGNLVAWVICGVIAGAVGYLARHKIGRALAAWWDRHHGPFAEARHRAAMQKHEADKQEGGQP